MWRRQMETPSEETGGPVMDTSCDKAGVDSRQMRVSGSFSPCSHSTCRNREGQAETYNGTEREREPILFQRCCSLHLLLP